MGLLLVSLVALGAGSGELSAEGLARYQRATADIGAGQFKPAVETLNGLAGEFPRVAEVFAARCSALIGLRNYAAAEADCVYALTVKPSLAAARYTLAMAEESQGKRDAAVKHYREYAALDERQAPYRATAAQRADALAPRASGAGGDLAAPPLVQVSTDDAYAAPVAPAAASAGGSARLVVYKNHLTSFGRLQLVLDGKLVGDLSMDEYVEITTSPGEHLLEARTYPQNVYDAPRTWSRPVRLGASPVYANFETRGGAVVLQEMPAAQARAEIQSDCRKAYDREIGPDSVAAPPLQQQVVVNPVVPFWPGAPVGVVVSSGARGCRFSSDCGEGDYSCRSWRGGQVCMGYGAPGAPCWFSSDCLSDRCDGSAKVCR